MDIFQILFYFIIIVPSAVVHEVAHGVAALALGDDTAQRAGRITLNPLVHIDPIGTVLMPIVFLIVSHGSFLFAYAKPVPYNPYNLKSEMDEVKVALAGPAANFLLAVVFAGVARFVSSVPALSGMTFFVSLIVIANIGLAIFNLIPIPPLDGSKLLYLLIPRHNVAIHAFLNQYSLFILFFFIFFGFPLVYPVITFFTRLLLGPVASF